MEKYLQRTEIRTSIRPGQQTSILNEFFELGLSCTQEEIVTHYFDNEIKDLFKVGAQLRLRRKRQMYELSLVIEEDPHKGLEFEYIRDTITPDEAEKLKKTFVLPNMPLAQKIAELAPGQIKLQGSLTTVRDMCDGREAHKSFIVKLDHNFYPNGEEDYEFKTSAIHGREEEAEHLFYQICDLRGITPSLMNVPNKYSRLMEKIKVA